MFKYFSSRPFLRIKEAYMKINTGFKGKIDKMEQIKILFTRIRLRMTPALNLRIKLKNLFPNKYPLTTILIALNIYGYFSLCFISNSKILTS